MDYTPSAEDFEDLYISDYEGFRIKNTKKLIQPVIQRKNYIADSRKGKSKREGYDKDRLLDQRKPFQPCDHDGPCSKALGCPCAVMEISCEKYCGCPKGCERRFRGCACASRGKPCSGKSCRCLDNNRECDPDLCGECGVIEVLGPMNRNAEPEFLAKRCRNCYIQRGIPKRTLMGTSSIHGFGLFMGEDIQAEEFIGEYKGELLASSEGERRGNIDWYRHLSYLFALNHEQDIDSMKYGNKMRFINEPPPDDPGKQNCYPKTYLCNTVLRLGLFALRDLKVGEELYFSYGERFAYKQSKEAQSPVKKGRGKAVAVQSKKSAKKSNTGKSIAGSSSRGTPSIATHSRATSQSSTIPPSETSFPRSGRRAQSLRELVPVHTDQEVNEAFGGEVALEPEFYEKDPEDDSDFQIDEDTVMGEVESSEHGVSSEMDAKVQVSPVKSPRKRRRAGGHCS
ncbi:SET domain-containing protein [Tothia fuscella]|uniref:SET domain-containing protein n=1 Tax=Tothia fuscella TaxID=1048955 RepID=A0A9P4U5A5_9PEZI|nr:SET domain-containing protein [Tothia fuscella]